ncbi:Arabinose 5-phosphate isomerase KpsF [compost metagenome]
MGDALAVTLMKARNFKPENFARFHPGGSLGRRLLSKVRDEMTTENLPFVNEDAQLLDVIHAMTQGGLGLTLVNCAQGWGLITDGDVRRALEKYREHILGLHAGELMSTMPVKVQHDARIEDALILMDTRKVTSLIVEQEGKIVGIFKK